jgi:hypothetical protein
VLSPVESPESWQSAPPHSEPHTTFEELPVPHVTVLHWESVHVVPHTPHPSLPRSQLAAEQIAPQTTFDPLGTVAAPHSTSLDHALASEVSTPPAIN